MGGVASDVATFVRFREYNWSADTAFLRGLGGMHAQWAREEPEITDDDVAERTAAAKLFYFQRYVAPLDVEAYQRWETEEAMRATHAHYQRFQAHDFDKDPVFQAGLPRLLADLKRHGIQGLELDQEVARSRMFYYSKRFGPVDWSAYELWSRVGSHKHANASGPLTCPFAPSSRGAATAAAGGPTDAPAPAAEPAALVCPYAPAGARSGPAGAAAAATETDRIHVTRTPTGLTKLKLVLESPGRCMDPRMVHALGNILLDCLTNAAVTAVLWIITAVPQYAQASLELWSLRHGHADAEALAAELRLLSMMARVVARVPVVVLIDAPLAGLAVPLALTAPLRIVTERAELRLAGSSLAGTSLGPLAHLPLHATRYLAFATAAAYGADMIATGAATHFVLASQTAAVEGKIVGAAACPPPHTGRAIRKTLDDLNVHPGPSRFAVFKTLVAELFEDATSPLHLTERVVGRTTTTWSTNVIAVLRSNQGRRQQIAWDRVSAEHGKPMAESAAALYTAATGGSVLPADWTTSSAPFPRLDERPVQTTVDVASWWP